MDSLLILCSLASLIICDTNLVPDIEYYISSNVNPSFVSNLVGYQDGTGDNWPGVGKNEGGTFGYARWKITSITDQPGYTLSCDSAYGILDIKGGSSSSPENPVPFLNNVNDPTLNGQSSWWFNGATESNLPNAEAGFWAEIYNSAWNLALSVPDMGTADAVAAELDTPPSSFDTHKYWFFASVTRGTTTTTETITQVTTSTGDTITHTNNAAGPVSTITSTVLNTLTTTTEVTTNAQERRALARRYDFTTVTETETSTHWLTSSVDGPIVEVTSQGGYVYKTILVTSSFYITETSTITNHPTQSTNDANVAATARPTETTTKDDSTEAKTQSNPSSTTPTDTTTQTDSGSGSSTDGASAKSANKGSSTNIAAIVGGTLGGILFIIIILLAAWFCRKHRRGKTLVTDDSPPGYSTRSELPPNSVHVAGWAPVAQVKPELDTPTNETRGEAPAGGEAERPNSRSHHELENGMEANMSRGPWYEMPGHSNF